jgi:hypothetical protein
MTTKSKHPILFETISQRNIPLSISDLLKCRVRNLLLKIKKITKGVESSKTAKN